MTLYPDVGFSYCFIHEGFLIKTKGSGPWGSLDTRKHSWTRPSLSTQLSMRAAPRGRAGPHLLAWRPGQRSGRQ